MILQENGTRFCTEGKVFTIGGIICANDESEYAGLCGTVMEIRSGDDCETENNTPDIYGHRAVRSLRQGPCSLHAPYGSCVVY